MKERKIKNEAVSNGMCKMCKCANVQMRKNKFAHAQKLHILHIFPISNAKCAMCNVQFVKPSQSTVRYEDILINIWIKMKNIEMCGYECTRKFAHFAHAIKKMCKSMNHLHILGEKKGVCANF
jgi:hypothetical protein